MILSFDMFDTIIKRDLSAREVLQTFLTPEQFEVRLESEKIAKQIYKGYGLEETKLEAIWNICCAHDVFKLKDPNYWVAKEMHRECRHIYANEHFTSLLQSPTHKLFVTDMYLPYKFFEIILEQTLHLDLEYCHLYVSGDIGLSKSSGNIWKYIYRDIKRNFGITEKIFHIGDNYAVDVVTPRLHNIYTYYYTGEECQKNILNLVTK